MEKLLKIELVGRNRTYLVSYELIFPKNQAFDQDCGVVRADLHGTIFVACDNGLRQALDMIYDCCVRQKKCRSILKHVLKRCDNRKSFRRPVVGLSHATKIVPCKSALSGSMQGLMIRGKKKEVNLSTRWCQRPVDQNTSVFLPLCLQLFYLLLI